MNSYRISIAAIVLAIAVGMGAFGAHALKTLVSSNMLATWNTAVAYQMWHGLALLVLAYMPGEQAQQHMIAARASWLLLAGTVLFSGSLYVLVLTGISALGVITPVGGVLLIAGWLYLAVRASRLN